MIFLFMEGTASAQWIRYPSAGLPRTANGEPNLKAPAPRLATGTPDLSGVWGSVLGEKRTTEPGPAFFNLENYLVPGSALTMLPSAEAIYRERRRVESAGRPSERCLPHGIPDAMLIPNQPFKIVHTAGLTLILYEEFARFRQVFTDGRPFPADLNPGWLGSSVGHWDGETFVVETRGFNDKTWLDDNGHPHTDALKTTERFRRINIGEMEVLMTFDDPGAYAKPWTVKLSLHLLPDTDLIEDVCDNEKDNAHTIKQ
ncbi:MAG: hypothetical protein ABI972_26895 [Acidobacteriota bacterium]